MEADRVMCMQFVVSFAFFFPFGGSVGGGVIFRARDENGTDIFRPYSKPNPFRGG